MTRYQVNEVFDYRTHRLSMGLIALLLPLIVSAVSGERLDSISASYYTEARDWMVGLLFVVGAFLLSYNGHTQKQSSVSKIAAFAAAGIAIFPTACKGCETTPTTALHFACAAILFSALAYFCLGPFREKLRGRGGKKQLRSQIYLVCGTTMIVCMVAIAAANLLLPAETVSTLRIVYWGEALALIAFGIAWFVSGKALPLLTDKDERLMLL
ncbi:hypothetical protein KBY96_10585 [Cyanobium sp. ATX 6A2]|uniref:hypothetical protein n=1 Tax=Cyanobium sp. ATX 6A2 TaxID=2823700 RepID=UPI0020CE163B|nr:hypothetical protein [Cyanobium sp. ATX 6A2]MCP9888370.1 hypothetical protein [Cyanobium sp. ATX 6A2]